jgi:release factor glutamine methyltransferase
MTVTEALAAARALGLDRLDATALLAHHLHVRREWLLAHPQEVLDAAASTRFEADCRRRADDVPLAYLTGQREFRGLQLEVNPSVLVPRPETELLADWAIECLRVMQVPKPRVVDLGTGSGALALAVGAAHPNAEIVGTDSSPQALAMAGSNASRLGLPVEFALGDWWAAVEGQRFDLALANPPYIEAGDPHLPKLRHEPRTALVAGTGGLAALQQIIDGARVHLSGWLLLEHGWHQAEAVQRLMSRAGLCAIETRLDLNGTPRCTGGCVA